MNICLTCGMTCPDCEDIIHARNPTLKRGAIHILIPSGSKSFIVSYSAPYNPNLHPLFPMPPKKRIQAILDMAELTREAELLSNQPYLRRIIAEEVI